MRRNKRRVLASLGLAVCVALAAGSAATSPGWLGSVSAFWQGAVSAPLREAFAAVEPPHQETVKHKNSDRRNRPGGNAWERYFAEAKARTGVLKHVLEWPVVGFLAGLVAGVKTGRPKLMVKTPAIALLLAVPVYARAIFAPSLLAGWPFLLFLSTLGLLLWHWTETLPAPWSWVFRAARPSLAPSIPVPGTEIEGSNLHGSAQWGDLAAMRAHGHVSARQALGLNAREAGFALGRIRQASTGEDARFRYAGHVLTCAPTGAGKGIGAVIPNLLDYPGSAVVLDLKGENYAVTARARRERGQRVCLVDPFGVTGHPSHAFNWLDRLDVRSPDCVAEAAALADCLVILDRSEGSSHFDETAKHFLQGLLLHVAGLKDKNLGATLPEVRKRLTSDPEAFLGLLADMAADEDAAFGIPARAANTLMGTADRERGSILSTARKNTAFLDDPRIAASLSRSDFTLDRLKTEPMTVYLVLPPAKLAANARFVRGFIGSALAAITASHQQPKHKVAFFLDEFAQLGHMNAIEDGISLVRGYGAAFWIFVQDLSQLKAVYPKWQTFLANTAKQFFGTADYDTAKYLSDSLGQTTVEFATESQSKNAGASFGGQNASFNRGRNDGSSQHYTGRALLTPDEIMRLGPRPIVLINGEPPYLLDRLDYRTDPEYRGQADGNPYHPA